MKRIPFRSLLNNGGKPVRKWSTTLIRKCNYKQLKVVPLHNQPLKSCSPYGEQQCDYSYKASRHHVRHLKVVPLHNQLLKSCLPYGEQKCDYSYKVSRHHVLRTQIYPYYLQHIFQINIESINPLKVLRTRYYLYLAH